MKNLNFALLLCLVACGKQGHIKSVGPSKENSNVLTKKITLTQNELSLKNKLLSKNVVELSELVFIFSIFPELNSNTFKKLDSFLVLNCSAQTELCEITSK